MRGNILIFYIYIYVWICNSEWILTATFQVSLMISSQSSVGLKKKKNNNNFEDKK